MSAKPSIICAGLVTVDVMYFVDQHPAEGEKHRAREGQMIVGGGALNAAATIAALGGHAILAGAVGDDLFGGYVRQEVSQLGIDDSLLVTMPDAATAHSAILVNGTGERTVVNNRDEKLFSTPPSLCPLFDGLLVDTRWRAAAAELLGSARSAKKPAVVDAEAPLATVEDLLPLASHVAFSEQGLRDLTGDPTATGLEAAAHRLQTWTCVTRGARSVLYHDGSQLKESLVQPVVAKNTLGAGDAWHGAFTLALAEGSKDIEAIEKANTAARQSIQQGGPRFNRQLQR